jgi:RNA polymerase sigma-70 factor, ECF subfamily
VLRLLQSAISPQTPDSALVTRAHQGDSQAFRALFERHVISVKRFLVDLLRDPTAAADATQETFTRAHAQLAKCPKEVAFKAWLFGIARNVAFENKRVKVHGNIDDDENLPLAVIPSPNPEDIVLTRELEGQLNEALAMLSPQRRAAFLMKVDHGLPYEDIASALGMNLQTVKNEIHRARLKLRLSLGAHLQGGLYE